MKKNEAELNDLLEEKTEEKIAVCLGGLYSFFFYEEIAHIKLVETASFVARNRKVYPLFKGEDFAESHKVVKLLDKSGYSTEKDGPIFKNSLLAEGVV